MRNALIALILVASTTFSLAEDRVRVGDCSVIASYLEDQITPADTDNPFHSEEICYRWQVRTTCNVQMRFDYRVRKMRGGRCVSQKRYYQQGLAEELLRPRRG